MPYNVFQCRKISFIVIQNYSMDFKGLQIYSKSFIQSHEKCFIQRKLLIIGHWLKASHARKSFKASPSKPLIQNQSFKSSQLKYVFKNKPFKSITLKSVIHLNSDIQIQLSKVSHPKPVIKSHSSKARHPTNCPKLTI